MFKVGLIGAVRIGNVHAQVISAHAASQLMAVSAAFQQNADDLTQTNGCFLEATEDISAAPSIDAVLNASSTDTHSDLMEIAVDAVTTKSPTPVALADVLDRGFA